jgi:hypothetical protein
MSFLQPVKFWICLAALASLAGWSLSAVGQLNRAGYAIFFAVAITIFFICQKKFDSQSGSKYLNWKKILRRFRHLLPCAFAALAFLVFLGGALYAPSNYTGLTYRVARVLQWLDHGQWWWIHTPNYRMNDRACGIEWIYAPLLLFAKSDRVLFLVNFIPFLLLPGLIFSVFTRLGVRARVAWQWMWLLPTSYNFLLQAGSIANDTFPVVFELAALDFALRARQLRKISDVGYSILAIALLTGAKGSNLPLLLPWMIAIFPSLPLLRRKFVATASICMVAATISFLPNAILNFHYCGDWSGANLEDPRLTMKNPLIGIYGNGFQLALDNFVPPIFPMAHWWNEHASSFMPHFLVKASRHFDDGFFMLGELPTEDWAGIGFGLSILLMVSVFASFRFRHRRSGETPAQIPFSICRYIFVAAWLSLLAYCVESGLTNAARITVPYYPVLIASLIVDAGQSEIVRRRWWRCLAGVTLILAFIVLILSPDRPLWPAKTVLSRLAAQHPDQTSITRALKVYTTYAQRADALAGVRALLPPGISRVGFIAGADDADISLWRPFGERSVQHFLLTDSPGEIRRHVEYVVIGGFNLKMQRGTIDDWLQKSGAELVGITNATLKVTEGVQPWYLARFKP